MMERILLIKKHDGGNDAPAVAKPGFQFGSSVSSSSVSQSLNTPTNSHFVHLASQHKPETPDVLNPEKPISATTESRQPSLNSASMGQTETQEQPFSMKPQSSSTLFGSGRPFVSFATPQQETREPVHIKPSSSLAESTRPLLSFGTTQQQTYKPVRVKPPSSTMTELEQPFLNLGTTQHDGYKPYPIKPQSNSAMIGLRQPFLNSAGTEAQEKPYEPYPIKLQSSLTLIEPARPLRFTSPQHHIHEPVRAKPPSSNQVGAERPFVNFGTTQHQSYGPYLVKPQSKSAIIGLRQPFLNSAGADAQEKLYKPYPIKLQSSSTLVEPVRPLRFASPQQNIHEPVGVEPQSSKHIGTERPLVNFGTTQTREQHPIKPQSNSNLIASARPFLSFAAPQQETYEPFHIKPQSSTPAVSERPYFGTTQQQTYEPYPIKPQSSSTMAASAKPFLNFEAPQQQTYEPFHIKPQSSSDRLTSDWPALNYAAIGHSQAQQAYEPFYFKSRSTSTHFGSEQPAFNSAAARQNYEPVHAKMQSYDSWPYFQDRSTMSSSQMRVQRQDSARNKLNRKRDYPKLFDVAGSDGHNKLAYV